MRRTRHKLRHGQNKRLERVDIARDDVLQVRHDLRSDGDRIDRLVRHRPVAAFADDADEKAVGCGHHRPIHNADFSALKRRPKVSADDDVHPVHDTSLHHLLRPAGEQFFRVLEQKADFTANVIAQLGENFRRPEKHRRMAVMSARMHHAWVF